MIRFLIDTTVSKRDVHGNCYHYSVVTSTKTGQSLTVGSQWGSDGGNVRAMLRMAGLDWSEIHYSDSMVGIREYNRMEPSRDDSMHEHQVTSEMLLDLEKATAKTEGGA